MLDTIRQLTTTLKLKDVIIANFIPEDISRNIEKRAQFNQEEDSWIIPVRDHRDSSLYGVPYYLPLCMCSLAFSECYLENGVDW
jgi:hypothetical protein